MLSVAKERLGQSGCTPPQGCAAEKAVAYTHLMAQNVQDPAQAGEGLWQPPKRPKKKRSIKKIVLLSLAGIDVYKRQA